MSEISHTDLIGTSQLVDPKLEQLDAKNLQHRSVVIKAVETLINDYIVPAMDLAQSSEGEVYFKLRAIASELSGLVRGALFDPKFPDLKKPSDNVLKETLDFIGIENSSYEERDDIFRCWAADMASSSIRGMLIFLEKTPLESTYAILEEASRFEKLLEKPLTSSLEYQISTLLEKLRKVGASTKP